MATNQIRNGDLMQDQTHKDHISTYVRQNGENSKILESKYPMYAWSERTLVPKVQYFDKQFTNYEVDIEDVKEAVRHGMEVEKHLQTK